MPCTAKSDLLPSTDEAYAYILSENAEEAATLCHLDAC